MKWVSLSWPLHPLKSTPSRTKETPPICLHPLIRKHLLYLPFLMSLCVGASMCQRMSRMLLWRRNLHLLMRERVACLHSHDAICVVHLACQIHHRLSLVHHIGRRVPENLAVNIIERASQEELRFLGLAAHADRWICLHRKSQFHHRLVGICKWIFRWEHERVKLMYWIMRVEGRALVGVSL